MKTHSVPVALVLALLPTVVLGAFAVGGIAHTKRVETKLLAEPQPLAAVSGRVLVGRTLQIEEIKGRWLRVSDGDQKGWVFAGDVAEEKPDAGRGLDSLPVAASETTATAAARPLAPAAIEYGTRKGLAKPSEDLKWLIATSDAINDAQVDAFLAEQKKGPFQ